MASRKKALLQQQENPLLLKLYKNFLKEKRKTVVCGEYEVTHGYSRSDGNLTKTEESIYHKGPLLIYLMYLLNCDECNIGNAN